MTHGASDATAHLSRLVVVRPIGASPVWLGSRLSPDAVRRLGREVASVSSGTRRFLVDMKLPIGDGRLLTFGKAAYVDIGRPRFAAAGWTADVA